MIDLPDDFRDVLIELADAAFDVEGRRIAVIGKEALIANKRAAGRAQDLADVEALSGGDGE
jgi:hypothetical protein